MRAVKAWGNTPIDVSLFSKAGFERSVVPMSSKYFVRGQEVMSLPGWVSISSKQPENGDKNRIVIHQGAKLPNIWPKLKPGRKVDLAILAICPYQTMVLRQAGFRAWCIWTTSKRAVRPGWAKKVGICWKIRDRHEDYARNDDMTKMADFTFVADGRVLSRENMELLELWEQKAREA